MYYCNKCGHVALLSRAENDNKPEGKPFFEMQCQVCKQDAVYRKLLPEDLHATNMVEFQHTFKALYKEIMKMRDEFKLVNQDEDPEEEEIVEDE